MELQLPFAVIACDLVALADMTEHLHFFLGQRDLGLESRGFGHEVAVDIEVGILAVHHPFGFHAVHCTSPPQILTAIVTSSMASRSEASTAIKTLLPILAILMSISDISASSSFVYLPLDSSQIFVDSTSI